MLKALSVTPNSKTTKPNSISALTQVKIWKQERLKLKLSKYFLDGLLCLNLLSLTVLIALILIFIVQGGGR